MTQYLTGELAKLCSISTRTLQYYDKKDLLKPAYIKDNNYRIYTDNKVERLKTILTLKDMGFSLKDIKTLLINNHDMKAVHLLLEQKIIQDEQKIAETQKKIKHMKQVKSMITESSTSPLPKINVIENILIKHKYSKQLYKKLFIIGAIGTLIQVVGLSISVVMKSYLPFIIALLLGVICAIQLTNRFYNSVMYMCPHCHTEFKPRILPWMFAKHTPKTRNLTCPNCQQVHHCVEIVSTTH
ncbi:MerR family transcriptional regulator [Staphylococcus sp. CH99b_3]|uniref:MerR family transcriptional regulator n=1 Tax=Staphylococcus sp. CH99b_3 TaxID=2651838 RepID=UPI00124BFEF5|nr:MerR family transcriptional regulator [Staphylococcus sp. CH99b_3]KAB2478776.1 MerR family transcriptional regulator [Staphylococcus sp. CH99b_3]